MDILLHIHLKNIKTLSPGTNILVVPEKNKEIPNLLGGFSFANIHDSHGSGGRGRVSI